MSKTKKTRHICWHETFACKCVCNDKKRWNNGKCICECKELIEKGRCDIGFICNPSICECECDK